MSDMIQEIIKAERAEWLEAMRAEQNARKHHRTTNHRTASTLTDAQLTQAIADMQHNNQERNK